MRISVFGLGYVGTVSSACLAGGGHTVVGVDSDASKVRSILDGVSPVVEPGLSEMIQQSVQSGSLKATLSVDEAIANTEMSIVCVGTPSQTNGSLDLSQIRRVCEGIGQSLKGKTAYHVVAIRSTLLPGSMRDVVIPTLEMASGKAAGRDFGVCNNPEFLREGSAVFDYYNPPKTVVGGFDQRATDTVAELYAGLTAPLVLTSLEVAEMVKYADNSWHAVKVAFANEIGAICKAIGLDSHRVMDIFCQDTKLNLSAYYLKPGFAFGGSCLPKDVRALSYKAKSLDVETPLMASILNSNEKHIARSLEMLTAHGRCKIGVLGFAFKAGTDDLRESPMVSVIEYLLGKGYEVKIYDGNVSLAALRGVNRDFILNHIPHIYRLMVDSIDQIMSFADTIVIGNGAKEFGTALKDIKPHQRVLDLVRIVDRESGGNYEGICW